MKLSKEQQQIVFSPEKKILLFASAAGGKTRCISERIKFLINSGLREKEIVALTLTNFAAEEMRERVPEYSKIFIGTLHSYATKILIYNNIDPSSLLLEENFVELLQKATQCKKILPFKYLLIDEAQDLTEEEFIFIFETLKPKNFFIAGDIRQSIYDFRNARPDLFYSISLREDTKTFYLKNNFRNAKNILTFSKRIINKLGGIYIDNSISKREEKGKIIKIDYDIKKIYNLIKTTDKLNKWFILCRTNEMVDLIYQELSPFLKCEILRREDKDLKEIEVSMTNNSIKIMTIHAAKGLENDNVIVIGAKERISEEIKISYVAATRARNLLIWVK